MRRGKVIPESSQIRRSDGDLVTNLRGYSHASDRVSSFSLSLMAKRGREEELINGSSLTLLLGKLWREVFAPFETRQDSRNIPNVPCKMGRHVVCLLASARCRLT